MLNFFITVFCFFCFNLPAKSQSIPDASLPAIEGDTIQLSNYAGKKLLIILLPVSRKSEDSLMLLHLETVYQEFKDSMAIIGIASYEDGYSDSLRIPIKNWYRETLHLSFPISGGLYAYNSSGIQQSELFRWLTNESMNGHFGAPVNSSGQKFLINANGELIGVFSEDTRLSNGLMQVLIAGSGN